MLDHPQFFAGMITMGMAVCSAFFLRSWLRAKEELFLAFSIAFALLAISHAIGAMLRIPLEERSWLYLFRLAAFSLIIVAILHKNFGKS